MKKFYTLFIALLISIIVSGQWVQQTNSTTLDLYDVHFVDSLTGWITGLNGSLFRTTNGGEVWTQLDPETTGDLRSVFFINENIGFIIGGGYNDNLIMKTMDGGDSWASQISNIEDGYLESMFFTNENTGYIVGSTSERDEVILKTTDGGQNWIRQFSDTSGVLTSVYFVNSNLGFAVGWYPIEDDWAALPIIIKTTDGGINWAYQDLGLNLGSEYLNSVFFIDELTGYATGSTGVWMDWDGFFIKTSDGGNTWSGEILEDSIWLTGCNSIFFTSPDIGYIAGNFQINGRVLKTTDGGENWVKQTLPDSPRSCNSVFFVSNEIGYLVCDQGSILKTTTGGGPASVLDININQDVLHIYPNPAHAKITIELPTQPTKNTSLSISNTNGQQHIKQPITEPQTEIDISHLPTGIYIIKVWNDKGVMVQKVIKQ